MKNLVVMFLAILTTTAYAQTGNKPQNNATPPAEQKLTPEQQQFMDVNRIMFTHFYQKYSVALQFNDLDVAKDALYDMLLITPASDSLLYNLGSLYYDNAKYPSAALVAQALLARNPKSVPALELSASSFESLNVIDKALANYETLYLTTNAPFVLYKMAFMQYQLKKHDEALANADIFLTKKEADEIKVTYDDKDGKPAEYAARVAILNLKGLIKQEKNDNAGAKKHFQEALAIAPGFEAARQNLAKIK
ncbi:MAG: hypothetical protein K1X47_02220 [Cyclobacteriaceae bacterium]|nr:hypothetical protein [Cyclobacteriaceae bacterium]